MNFEIFKASRRNFEEIKNLMLIALKEDPLGFSASFEEYSSNSDFWWFSYIDPYISDGKDFMFLAKKNEKLVGMGGITFDIKERKKHVGLVVWVYVLKEYRRQGLAKLLMNSILEESKKNDDVEKITLFVNSSQEAALNLYKNLGFEISGTLKKDIKIDGKYIDTNIMEMFI